MGVKLKLQPINWDSKDQELEGRPLTVSGTDLPQSEDGQKNVVFRLAMDNHQVHLVSVKRNKLKLKVWKKQQQVVSRREGSASSAVADKTDELKNAKRLYTSAITLNLKWWQSSTTTRLWMRWLQKSAREKDQEGPRSLNDNLSTEKYVVVSTLAIRNYAQK